MELSYLNLIKKSLLVPKKIREKGFIWTLKRAKVYVARESVLNPVIPSLHVEVTSYCNLRCAGCSRTVNVSDVNWKNQHMSVSDFQKLVDGLPFVGDVLLYGLGESSLHPSLPEIVRIAHASKKFNTIFAT